MASDTCTTHIGGVKASDLGDCHAWRSQAFRRTGTRFLPDWYDRLCLDPVRHSAAKELKPCC